LFIRVKVLIAGSCHSPQEVFIMKVRDLLESKAKHVVSIDVNSSVETPYGP